MRNRGLQTAVGRIGVGIERLKRGRINSEVGHSRRGIGCRVLSDRVLGSIWGAIYAVAGAGHDDGVRWASQVRLVGVKGRAQMGTLGADVCDLEDPVSTQLTLHGEVPLLRGGHTPVQGSSKTKEAGGGSGELRCSGRSASRKAL